MWNADCGQPRALVMATATEGGRKEVDTALGKCSFGTGGGVRMKPGKPASVFTQRSNGATINSTALR